MTSVSQFDRVRQYDEAMDRASIAAIVIRRHVTRAQAKDESLITARHALDAHELAKRLEAIVADFGLES